MMSFLGGLAFQSKNCPKCLAWSQGYSVITNEAAMELNEWLKSKMEDLGCPEGSVMQWSWGWLKQRRRGVFLPWAVSFDPLVFFGFVKGMLGPHKWWWSSRTIFSRLYFSELEVGYHEFHADRYIDIWSTMGCALKNTPIHRWILWWW